MRTQSVPLCILPANLSEEAAAELLACLRDITRVLEEHYADVLEPDRHRVDQRQQPLWPDNDTPF